jgi:hypothetical protein
MVKTGLIMLLRLMARASLGHYLQHQEAFLYNYMVLWVNIILQSRGDQTTARENSQSAHNILITGFVFNFYFLKHNCGVIGCRSQCSAVVIATRLRAGRPGFDSRQRQWVFPLLHIVQTDSGAQPASYPMEAMVSFTGGKVVGAWS